MPAFIVFNGITTNLHRNDLINTLVPAPHRTPMAEKLILYPDRTIHDPGNQRFPFPYLPFIEFNQAPSPTF
jgi:hypothetical protein